MPASLEVVADTLYGLVKLALKTPRRAGHRRRQRSVPILLEESVHPSQETLNAFNAGILPIEIAVGRSGEQAVEARSVGAVARHHFVRADDVAQVFLQYCAIFNDHALREQALDRLVVGDEAHIAHELAPEARVNQVQDGMFDAPDVLVNGKPVLRGLGIERSMIVMRVG